MRKADLIGFGGCLLVNLSKYSKADSLDAVQNKNPVRQHGDGGMICRLISCLAIVAKSKTIPCYFFIFYAIVNVDFEDVVALDFLKVGHRWRIGGPWSGPTQPGTTKGREAFLLSFYDLK
jgi:hypothetical protein